MAQPYYLSKLTDELESRKRRNPSYTLRAFARYLDLPAPVLSEVLRQKRGLPKQRIPHVISRLALSPKDADRFLGSASFKSSGLRSLSNIPIFESDYRVLNEERDFKIIAEWEFYAVFELVDVKGFLPDPEWIAKRLGITSTRATSVLNALVEAGLLERSKGRYRKTSKQLTTSQDVQSLALRKSHKESLEMAAVKLESIPLEYRFFSSSTIPVDKNKLAEAKDLIREFRKRLTALLSKDRPTEVYQFCIQLFPLTQISSAMKGPKT